jgi:hypothetical protein
MWGPCCIAITNIKQCQVQDFTKDNLGVYDAEAPFGLPLNGKNSYNPIGGQQSETGEDSLRTKIPS